MKFILALAMLMSSFSVWATPKGAAYIRTGLCGDATPRAYRKICLGYNQRFNTNFIIATGMEGEVTLAAPTLPAPVTHENAGLRTTLTALTTVRERLPGSTASDEYFFAKIRYELSLLTTREGKVLGTLKRITTNFAPDAASGELTLEEVETLAKGIEMLPQAETRSVFGVPPQ